MLNTSPSVVGFVDVLGVKDQVKAAFADSVSEGDLLLNAFHNAVTTGSAALKWLTTRPLRILSDSILLSHEFTEDGGDGEAELGLAISDLASFQLSMLHDGFFVRGGIAIGQDFTDDYVMFGDAIVSAVEIEQSVACFPRIVLSQRAVEMAVHHMRFYAPIHSAPQNRILKVDADEKVFVNYLADRMPDRDTVNSVLTFHRDAVKERIVSFEGKATILAKYRWVAQYHNWFCQANRFEDLTIAGEGTAEISDLVSP